MPPIVEAKNLSKSFGSIRAVNDVSFTIEEGEIFSLLGPNGAGKSTTINMLSCLLLPDSGDAVICGYSITRDAMAVKRVIGLVPQEIALYNHLTARENLVFWGRMYGLDDAALRKRVDEVLQLIGLTDRAKDRISTFSGGMKRRVNIGVGLLHSPRIIYMDEPTVGIDPQSRRNILDSVKALNRQGMTVLYTTHYMEEAQELSDRVGIIDHGKMIALGTQRQLTEMVGEHETLRLHLGEDENSSDLASALASLRCVLKVSTTDHEVVLLVPQVEEALAPVITKANMLGVKIRSVDMEEPNLETVFLHLTGRALRDQ